jgi:hypothetical protein
MELADRESHGEGSLIIAGGSIPSSQLTERGRVEETTRSGSILSGAEWPDEGIGWMNPKEKLSEETG